MRMAYRTIMVVLAMAALAAAAQAEWKVWTLAQTRRVLRDEPAGTGKDAALRLARNEWRGFQILLRSDEPVKGINVVPGDLVGPEGAVLAAADARLYRQHQMEIKVGTYRNKDFKPGWYPDPLIPFDHPLTRRPLGDAKLRAVPFDLPADETHGFWVDLYVPMEAKAGVYRGTYRVTAAGGRAVEVPVTATVWDFALPLVPTMQTCFGSPAGRMRGYYRERAKAGKEPEPADWNAVDDQANEMLARHRINAVPPPGTFVPQEQPDGSFLVPPDQVMFLRMFIDNYHINAFQTAHPSSVIKDPEKEKDRLLAWLRAYDAAAAQLDRPHVLLYTYLKDEPNDAEAYAYVRAWGEPILEAKGALKVLVTEQAKTQNSPWGDLIGAVNIWCPLMSLFDPSQEGDGWRLIHKESIWTYTALCQGEPTPWWHIDWPLLNYRAPAWIAYRSKITGLLYWGGMAYWKEVDDPWTDPWTYGHGKGGEKGTVYNGEGTLVYPGRPCGYDGVAESLRLKALRDGIEDYEYLAMLRRTRGSTALQDIVQPLATSWFAWEKNPAAYDTARAALAERILATKRPFMPPPKPPRKAR
ncbi:MAG: DUF4091 domain-containing protein [Planctomycetota bacterium]|nr:DUF4091 domain-containing protein [Planctomycetota bacterium]